jgi:hypothetical protein
VSNPTASVRDLVRQAQNEMRGDLQPERARDLLTMLTALIGVVNLESRQADLAFNRVLVKHLETERRANRALILAEGSDEYMRAREAKDCKQEIVESIRSLKKFIDSLSDEMRLTR